VARILGHGRGVSSLHSNKGRKFAEEVPEYFAFPAQKATQMAQSFPCAAI
jgi:hypothetical protein